jgi:hypothetical protein
MLYPMQGFLLIPALETQLVSIPCEPELTYGSNERLTIVPSRYGLGGLKGYYSKRFRAPPVRVNASGEPLPLEVTWLNHVTSKGNRLVT